MSTRKLSVGEKIKVHYSAVEIHGMFRSDPFDGEATIEKTADGYIIETGNYVRFCCGDNRGLKSWKGAIWSFLDSGDTRHTLISAEEIV